MGTEPREPPHERYAASLSHVSIRDVFAGYRKENILGLSMIVLAFPSFIFIPSMPIWFGAGFALLALSALTIGTHEQAKAQILLVLGTLWIRRIVIGAHRFDLLDTLIASLVPLLFELFLRVSLDE